MYNTLVWSTSVIDVHIVKGMTIDSRRIAYVHTRNFKKFPRLLGIIMPKKVKFPKPR